MHSLKECEQRILELESLLEISDRKSDVLTSLLMEASAEFEGALDRVARSERNFRAVFETAPEPIYLIDVNTRQLLDCNEFTLDWLGYSRDELISMPADSIVAVDAGAPDNNDEKTAYLERTPVAEWRFRKKDGTVVTADVAGTPLVYEGRECFAVLVHDITERKRAEEALRRSEANYHAIFDSMNDAVFVHDIETGEILDVNQKMCEMYGYEREEARKLTVGDLSSGEPPYSEQDAREWIRKAAASEQGLFEWRARDKAGSLFWTEISLRRALIDGEPRLLAVVRDITERKRSEEERERLRSQLLQAQKMEALGTLSGGIAHDFNNMLTIILGYAEIILSETSENDPCYQDLQKMIQTTQKGADLVQRLLTFSKQTAINPRPLNLNAEIEQFERLLSRIIPKMIAIKLILSDDLRTVHADPVQVDQILMNLAINAKDAMPEGGKILIETKNVSLDEEYCRRQFGAKPGDYVVLTISDTGHGMDRDTVARIFDPFFTTKGRDSRKGTGLGLAVVKGIVEQHGGHVSCSSEPSGGTSFNVYLPALAPRCETNGLKEGKPTHGTETILLVDDEDLIRDLGERILRKAGYNVVTASDGKEALERYATARESISLVVLDLVMPEMSGKQCLQRLLALDPNVQVLIASGYSASDEQHGTGAAGAKGFVGKPYDMKRLLRAVRDALDNE
jgi:two-component system, cell cycle sensor histidine kinase and response regulator CckA